MSRAILLKTLRDYWLLTLIVTLALVAFEALMVRFLLIEIAGDIELLRTWLELPLIRTMVKLALGGDLVGELNASTLATVGLAHPLIYAATWALLLAMATGVTAGEIGRGTADLLLALPVSRASVYISTSLAWALVTIPICLLLVPGLWLGTRLFPIEESLQYGRLALVTVNLWVLNLSIAAVTMCIGSIVSRRGVAIGIALTGLLISDLLNFIAQFWKAAEPLAVVGFLHYYRPLPIVRTGVLPPGDITVLLTVGAVAWLIGLAVFTRRDIPAA